MIVAHGLLDIRKAYFSSENNIFLVVKYDFLFGLDVVTWHDVCVHQWVCPTTGCQ